MIADELYRSYLVVVNKDSTKRPKKRSVGDSGQCDHLEIYNATNSKDSICYITAELSSSDIGEEGYVFVIGDSKRYGRYYNGPLEAGQEYSAHIVITIQLEVCLSVTMQCCSLHIALF